MSAMSIHVFVTKIGANHLDKLITSLIQTQKRLNYKANVRRAVSPQLFVVHVCGTKVTQESHVVYRKSTKHPRTQTKFFAPTRLHRHRGPSHHIMNEKKCDEQLHD
jgi:hypothetical protein